MSDLHQIRLQDLPGAILPGNASLPIEQEDVGFPDQERSNEAMLKEATQNRRLSESFVFTRAVIGGWNLTETMLRAYVPATPWKGSDQLRSHLGIPLLAEHFGSIHKLVQQTLFSGYRPFQIDPAPGTPIDAAVAQEAIVTAQLKTCGIKGVSAKQEIRAVTYDGLLYGTGFAFIGWQTKKIKITKKRPKHTTVSIPTGQFGSVEAPQGDPDELEEYTEEKEINQPVLEHVPIRRMRVAPDCRRGDVRTAKWAGRIIYLSAIELDQLRDVEGYNIPTREELIQLTTPQRLDSIPQNQFDTQGGNSLSIANLATTPQKANPESLDANTADPLSKDFEIFEYWTPYRVVWVLNDQYPIRNDTHDLGRIPFLSFNFFEAPESLLGYGLGYWLTNYQKIAQGIINAYFDDLNLNMAGTYVRPAGLNSTAQAEFIFPGKVFKTDTPEQANGFKQLQRNSIGNDPIEIVQQVKAWAASISGAGAGVQGTNPGKTGDMRNAAGVNLLASGENIKMQDLIDQISELILVPFIEFCIEQNFKLKPSQIREMLSQELGDAWRGTPLDVINGTYRVTISAGSKLAARQALNQSLGFIESILQSPGTPVMLAQQAAKIDFKAMITALFESTGYPYQSQIIVPMNDEDKKRVAEQQNKLPQDLQKIQAQAAAKKDVDNNQAENRALLRTQEHMFQTSDQNFEKV